MMLSGSSKKSDGTVAAPRTGIPRDQVAVTCSEESITTEEAVTPPTLAPGLKVASKLKLVPVNTIVDAVCATEVTVGNPAVSIYSYLQAK